MDKCQFIERFLSKKDLPYQKIEGKTFEDVELLRYIITVPDDLASNIIESLSKIVNTKQRDIFITTNKIDATVSEYLHDLVEKIKKTKEDAAGRRGAHTSNRTFCPFQKRSFLHDNHINGNSIGRDVHEQSCGGDRCHVDFATDWTVDCFFV